MHVLIFFEFQQDTLNLDTWNLPLLLIDSYYCNNQMCENCCSQYQ